MRTPTRLLIPAALAVLLAVGGGCSSGGHDNANDDVATLGQSTDNGSSDSDGGGSGGAGADPEFQDAVLEFAECMRDHGIDMPDPQITEDGGVLIQAGRAAGGGGSTGDGEAGLDGPTAADDEAMQEAQEACQPIMDEAQASMPKPDPEQLAEMQDQALEFAQCMRDHGIDFPDPTFDDEGGRMTVAVGGPADGGNGPHIDPDDPDFQDAAEACGQDSDGGFSFGGPVSANGDDG